MKPTWDSLAPILRGADVRSDSTWAVLEAHADFLHGHVGKVLGGARDVADRLGGHRAATRAAVQWVFERLYRRVLNPPPGLPVSERADGARGSAPAWFATVIRNLTRDFLKSERRRTRRETEIDERRPPSVRDEPPALWDEGALKLLANLLARPERAGIPDTHVLAYLCLYRPDVVDEAMVQRAHAYVPSSGSRSGRPGLIRGVAGTWAALQAWRARHGDEPRSSAARAELAWALRSDDAGDPTTWRTRHPDDARRSAVTVGKWAIRCARELSLPRA